MDRKTTKKSDLRGLLGEIMSGQGYGGQQPSQFQNQNRFAAFNPQGLMAEGFSGSPGQPTYAPNRRNPNRLDMTGFSPATGQGPAMPSRFSPPMMAQQAMPMYPKGFGDGPPPVGNPGATPPGVPGGGYPPASPPGVPPGVPSAPPGGPTNPMRPMSNQPYGTPPPGQPGQVGWGLDTSKYVPQMSQPAQNYILQQMYGISSSGLPLGTYGGNPAPWADQVDPNNYLASIGQLSGKPYGG